MTGRRRMVLDRPVDEPATPPEAGEVTGRSRWVWPLLVVVVTALYAAIPYALHEFFYQRGDTAAQFAPTWYHLGEMVRGGQYPPVLDPDAWQGGNYAAEALHGIYNPLNLLVWLFVSLSPDLMVATFLVKALVMVMLALGTYLLAREYASAPWAAAVVATAIPFTGFTLYWDAGSWPSGLIAFAYTPWVWWAFRRCLRGVGNPFWAVLVGILAVTQGNPYGALSLVAVGVALVVEGVLTGNLPGAGRLVLVGACVAAFLPLVYLPLLENSQYAVRSTGALFENSGKMRPQIGDLFGLGSPTYVPGVQAISGPMQVPATYFTWLLLPLLPWLRWSVLRVRWRELSAVGVVAAGYLLLTVGPSKLWLFRWPVRLIEYGWLGLAVVLAVLLSAGLHRTRVRERAAGTAVLVAFTGYVTWAQHPADGKRLLLGLVLVGGLSAVVLGWHHARPTATAALALLCIGGTGVVLVGQNVTFGENASSRVWHVPSDVSALQDRFAAYDGRTMQFADLKPLQNRNQIGQLEKAWDSYLPGSMYQVADVEAVNNYTGLGYKAFGRRFCMEYDGLTQPCGYEHLWAPGNQGRPDLADQMKLETIVVQPAIARGVTPDPGWSEQTSTDEVLVLHRDAELPWPDARLSWAADGVDVTSARTVGELHEQVVLADGSGGGELVFATISWPGWHATLDGKDVEVGHTKAGLLTVDLPQDASGTLDLTFSPPGQKPGLALGALGLAGGVALGVLAVLRRRRATPDDVAPAV